MALRLGKDPALLSIEHLHLVPEAALVRSAVKRIHQCNNALLIYKGKNLSDAAYAKYVQVGRSKVRLAEDRYIVLLDPNKPLGVRPIGQASAFPPGNIAASSTLKQPINDQAICLLDG